ncbi:hypothetical protein KCU88_g358, partial [Aureobasidium melanogenum]
MIEKHVQHLARLISFDAEIAIRHPYVPTVLQGSDEVFTRVAESRDIRAVRRVRVTALTDAATTDRGARGTRIRVAALTMVVKIHTQYCGAQQIIVRRQRIDMVPHTPQPPAFLTLLMLNGLVIQQLHGRVQTRARTADEARTGLLGHRAQFQVLGDAFIDFSKSLVNFENLIVAFVVDAIDFFQNPAESEREAPFGYHMFRGRSVSESPIRIMGGSATWKENKRSAVRTNVHTRRRISP